ncbi:chitin synthase chs-2-like [Heterodontus francisci]|uniref:chitin synthase chs-2-like n=1 Tax=Heterodontus francisci TaxID=7792 RepID=UPI00355C7904
MYDRNPVLLLHSAWHLSAWSGPLKQGDDSIHFTNKPFSHLILGCTLLIPNILTVAKCLWKLSFRSESMVFTYSLITVCILEAFTSFGTASLVVICLPHYDILTTVFISNSISLIPSILQVVSQKASLRLSVIGPLSGLLLLLCGYIFFLVGQCLDLKEHDSVYLGLTIFFSVLTSLSWRENFISNWKYPIIKLLRSELDKSRNMVSLWTSVVRIVITASVVGSGIAIKELEWETVSDVASHEIRIILGLFAVQAGASVLCSWFGVVACKIHAMRRSFVLPLILNTPVKFNLSDFCAHSTNGVNNTFSVEILYSEIVHSICSLQGGTSNQTSVWLLGVAGACWWVGFILTTIYLWTQNINRIQRTSEIFVRRMYEAPFLEQSMLLNKRIHINPHQPAESNPRKTRKMMIYVCATMWHETLDEMIRIISSLFRLDQFKEKRRKAAIKSDDSFDFEIHIMFDDAFRNITDKEAGTKKRVLNEYVESLIKAMEETYRLSLKFTLSIAATFLGKEDVSLSDLKNLTKVKLKDLAELLVLELKPRVKKADVIESKSINIGPVVFQECTERTSLATMFTGCHMTQFKNRIEPL